MSKKILILFITLFIVSITGCESPQLKADIAANARAVEGHIKNIEYSIIQKAFEDGTGDLTLFDGKTSDAQIRLSFSMPDGDYIYCSSLTIENGTVTKASNCSEGTWNNSFSYTENEGAYRE